MHHNYQSFTNETSRSAARSWRNFFVFMAGKTNGAHQRLVDDLIHAGHNKVDSADCCDYLLVFCPVVSRVQSDIEDGLSRIPANKPVALVVMHHTFDPNKTVAKSARGVENPNVFLTVDYLFFDNDLLNCDLNDASRSEIWRFFQLSLYQEPLPSPVTWPRRLKFLIAAVLFTLLVILLLFLCIIIRHLNEKN